MSWLKRLFRWWVGDPWVEPLDDEAEAWHRASEGPR